MDINSPIPFESIQDQLSKLNIIVGFDQGLPGGSDDYFYMVYHKEKDRFYWYLRSCGNNQDVYFYEVTNESEILELLQAKPVDRRTLHRLSTGETTFIPPSLRKIMLFELFGEDTEHLRFALTSFYPGGTGSKYPYREFHERYFAH